MGFSSVLRLSFEIIIHSLVFEHILGMIGSCYVSLHSIFFLLKKIPLIDIIKYETSSLLSDMAEHFRH